MHNKQLRMIPQQLEGMPICEAYVTQTGVRSEAAQQAHCREGQPQRGQHSPGPTESTINQSVHTCCLQGVTKAHLEGGKEHSRYSLGWHLTVAL